jgi:hypothetical protein
MAYFLEQVQVVMPVVGFDFLKLIPTRHNIAGESPSPDEQAIDLSSIVLLYLESKSGIRAEGALSGEELTVFSGSTAQTRDYSSNSYATLRKRLIFERKIVPADGADLMEFSDNVVFSSASAASSVILNRNDNGVSWRVKETGKSLKEWEEAKLGALDETKQ